MKTYLGYKGYTIRLKDFTDEQICKIKEDLTFTPFHPKGYGPEPIPFSIFGISNNKMFLPKFYGIATFGKCIKNKILDGDNIKLKFNGSLRENQMSPVKDCIEAANNTGGGILCLPCGFGKCLGINTPIIMYDGTIKKVQNIKEGDLLMGDDSTSRKVINICRGKEQMYKVIQSRGDSYIVNESHILSLKYLDKKSKILDISVKDYLNLIKSNNYIHKKLLGYSVPINFNYKKVGFDPYIIGVWIGCNNHIDNTIITTKNSAILKYICHNLNKYNMYLNYVSGYDYKIMGINNINYLTKELVKEKLIINSIKNRSIPINYKCNSKNIRLKILAGIIDTLGEVNHCGIKITIINKKLYKDIIFICRSLGIVIYNKLKLSYNIIYYTVFIPNEELFYIPFHIKLIKNKIKKNNNSLLTEIKLEKLGIENYYGFEINGNKRFLLGDFTVTHNTSISLYIIAELKVKALIIVNKEFLMDQWKERIQQFLPDAKIGTLRQKTIDIANKDIVIAMLQSIAMCEYDYSIYKSFGITFYDEVHCVPSKIFSKALRKINTKYHFGLSATPNRSDGMTKITKLYIGPIIYKVDKNKQIKNPKNLHVFTISFDKLPENKYYKSLFNYRGKPDVVKMINNIIQCPERIALISIIIRYFIINDNRHILVLSDRIQYLRNIENKIKSDLSNILPFKIGYYIGGMKQCERKETETSNLILASYSMAKEAMDIPILDTLFMVTSKSNIEQPIGRIQRKTVYPIKRPPLVIDFIDFFSSFQSQFNKRELFYKKNQYIVNNFIYKNDIDNMYFNFKEIIDNIS